MSDKVKKEKKLNVDPATLLDSLKEVDILVDCHVKLLETVKKLIQKYVKSGMEHDQAAMLAVTLHKRAAEKARSMVPNDLEEDESSDSAGSLTPEQIKFLLYSLCSESHEEMIELMSYIDTACLTCETLRCRELFDALDISCPEELSSYGWNKPRKLLDSGYFFIYNEDEVWHIECPMPERIE